MPVSEATYRQLAVEDRESAWELVCGKLRQKPGMTLRHNSAGRVLAHVLQQQLPIDQFQVGYNSARLRLADGSHYIPDIVVIPVSAQLPHEDETGVEAYPEPMPLVVEVWSPSTGNYDAREKLEGYRRRGDAEVWLVDARERTVTAWKRGAEGSYSSRTYRREHLPVSSLPGVIVDMDAVFRAARL